MQFVDSGKRENVCGLSAIEVDLDHQIGATSDDERGGVVAPECKGLVETPGRCDAHAVPSQPANASIMAFVSPRGYKIGHVAPLSM